MKRILVRCLLVMVLIPVWFSQSQASLEWSVQRTLRLKDPPVDVAVSLNGKWIFVLTEPGSIHVYTPGGRLQETIQVGGSYAIQQYATCLQDNSDDKIESHVPN